MPQDDGSPGGRRGVIDTSVMSVYNIDQLRVFVHAVMHARNLVVREEVVSRYP